MTSRLTELSVDCADPDALAAFWCAVLDYEVRPGVEVEEGVITIGPRDGLRGAPTLTFARVPETKIVKNRLHLDLSPQETTQEAEVERLTSLGARRADVGQGAVSWVVMTDPEGNEFCVLGRPTAR